MTRITILSTINLKTSNKKAVAFLRREGCDNLFLDFPRDQEKHIRSLALGIPPQEVIQRLRDEGLIREPEDTQRYRAAEPLFDYLPHMSPETGIYCFGDPVYHRASGRMMGEILVLTWRSKLMGIKIDEWVRALGEELRLRVGCAEREAEAIAARARGASVCVGASEDIGSHLEERGFRVEFVELDRSYSPLDVLRGKMWEAMLSGDEVPDETVEKLVRYHIKFTDLIMSSHTFEEAYRRWVEKYSREIDETK
ncbi:MAG: hypothetical protein ACE5GD_07430 [Candidatus Geothermarchaeales archaeon]